MEIINRPLTAIDPAATVLRIAVDRLTLAKRRWRGVADDGTEFGFDLEKPLADGAVVFVGSSGVYCLAQKYEPVLEVSLAAQAPVAAKLGWLIGNLHFQIEIAGEVVRVADDPALRQLFAREGLAFTACKRVFHPMGGGHSHGHHHH